jgi:ABC-type branched-subunit amino acid transport system substrate-binding protein
MARRSSRVAAAVALLALVAAACGGSRDATTASTASAPAVTTAKSSPSGTGAPSDTGPTTTVSKVPMFGDAPWPCGPGAGNNTDDGSTVGVTAKSINIASGDDAGYAASPGLNHEITDAMKALVAKCNELGGINGRTINLNYYDAKILEVNAAMQSACDAKNFFLVGQGWAFDQNQEEIRLGCGLPAVPAYSVSAAFAHGKDVFQGVPNPSDETTSGFFAQIAKLFPEESKHVGTLTGAISFTQETRDKVVAVAPQFGWQFAETTLESNITGEPDWTPFVKQLKDAGAQMVSWQGTCLPSLLLFAQTAKLNGLDAPIVVDSNHYTAECAAANTDGALDKLYVRMAFVPFEEASANKATQDYIDLVKASGGDTALLGAQATSSFLLWATAASACGAQLTRECVLANLAATHSWTGHGLHAETDPGGNHPPKCSVIVHLVGTKFERVVPKEPGTFECDDTWISPITGTAALEAAKLDENRISQQFATG